MAIGDIIVGIDIGTSRIAAVVGEVNNFNQIEIICSSSYKCTGIKKTKIINEEEVSNSLVKVLDKIEDESGLRVNSAYVTIPGKYTTIVQNSITKEARDKYSGISLRDVQTAIMQVKDIDIPEGKVSIDIVPDKFILDTGKTLYNVKEMLEKRHAKSVKIVTLLDKEEGRVFDMKADYSGFKIPNAFVVGYGLDFNERYRQLPYIGILKEDCYKK